jgi:hypothetical protein
MGGRCQTRLNVLAVVGLFQNLPVLGVARDDAGEGENTDCHGDQQADYEAENIEEMGILLAHGVIRLGAGPAAQYSRERSAR